MSVEKNLKTIERLAGAYNARNWDLVSRIHAESVIGWTPDSPNPRKGREAIRDEFIGWAAAFPDSKIEVERVFGQKEWVHGEFVFSGTHKGPLPGPGGKTIPATNKPVRLQYAVAFKFEGEEITERHEYFDLLGVFAQLGIAP